MRGDSVSVKLDIPKERRADSTTLTVQIAPSMATTMLDALPYLIDYPYGCTEQTMSRFLPAVITAKTLRDLGLKPETAMHKIFGGIEAVECCGNSSERSQRSERTRANHEAGSGTSLRLSTRRRRLGLVERRRERSLHDRVCRLGHESRAPGRHRREVGSRLNAPRLISTRRWLKKETSYDCAGMDAPCAGCVSRDAEAVGGQQVPADGFHKSLDQPRQAEAYTRALLALAAHNYGYQRSSEDARRESRKRRQDRFAA